MLLFFFADCFFAPSITSVFLKLLSWLPHVFLPFGLSHPAPFPFFYVFCLCNTNQFCCLCFALGFFQFARQESMGFSPCHPRTAFLWSCIFLGELFFIPQRIIYHLYTFWHMRILNLSLLFVLFLLVVGPHRLDQSLVCSVMQMSVMKENTWEHHRENTAILP